MIKQYLKSSRFLRYSADWVSVAVLLFVFLNILESSRPFDRQFSLSDLSISHPFAHQERVTDNQLYLLSIALPTVVIIFTSLSLSVDRYYKIHLLQVSLLGLWLSFVINASFTDILKGWIGRPRPDFLARCGPKDGTPFDILVDVSVCTSPLGEMYLRDGMKSCPSGHSSIGFCGLGYLSLWLLGQFKAICGSQPIYKSLIFSSPLLLSTYIALSRVQDYRHHFSDVLFGSFLGILFAIGIYHSLFNCVWSKKSAEPADSTDDQTILPIH